MHIIFRNGKRIGTVGAFNGTPVLRSGNRKVKKAFREFIKVEKAAADEAEFERYLPEGYTVEESEPV